MSTAPALSPTGNQAKTQKLTTTNGTWTGCNQPFTYSYAWYWSTGAPPNGTKNVIPGVPSTQNWLIPSSYGNYVGDYITASVTVCDLTDVCSGAASTGYAYLPPAPTNTAAPTISPSGIGQNAGGTVFTAAHGTWSSGLTISGYGYQWYRNGTAISGATGSTYTANCANDAGTTLTVKVDASNADATSGWVASSNNAQFVPCNTAAPTVSPSGTGKNANGTGFTAAHGTWAGSPTAYAYQWLRNGAAISGATSSSYTANCSSDAGTTLTVEVRATNAYGTSGWKGSTISAQFVPCNTAAPSFAGTTQVGSVLTGSDGTWWSGISMTPSRQWQSCGYRKAVLADSPLDYWRLGDPSDSSATARDEVGEANDGSYVGTSAANFGAVGALSSDANSAVNFDGAEYIDLSNPVQLDSGDFTVEGWFETSASGSEQQIWMSGYDGGNQRLSLFLSSDGTAHLAAEDSSGASVSIGGSSAYNDGLWHYVAAVRSGSTFTLYVDGASVASGSASLSDVDTDGVIPRIGDGLGDLAGRGFDGSLDEVAIYNDALSSSRVSAHYNEAGNAASDCANISGATGQSFTPTGNEFGDVVRYGVSESNAYGSSSTVYSGLSGTISDQAPSTPTNLEPSASDVPTATPVLSGTSSDPDGPIDFEFQLASDNTFSEDSLIDQSGWLTTTNTWTVPAGDLEDGGTYYFRVRARDAYQDTTWSSASSFTLRLPKLGANSSWAMWSHGPVSVNEGNGNMVLALPTPSYPTATGTLGLSLTYNSQASAGSPGLGNGWTLIAGDGSMTPPVKLIDHTVVDPIMNSAEVVWPDGSSSFYNQVGTSNTYLAQDHDGSQLTQNQDGSGWTLIDSDGTTYSFGSESSGVSQLTAAQTAATTIGDAKLTYGFDANGRITSLTYHLQPGDSGETLTFNWNCTGLFCVTGPDGRTWTYSANASNQITGVNDGTRQLVALTYTNGVISKLQNADDLDPTHASPGYNGAHAVQIGYDSHQPGRVNCVSDGPISGQAASLQPSCSGGGSAALSTWTFGYATGSSCPSLKAPAATHEVSQGTMYGCTTVVSPDLQPVDDPGYQSAGVTVLYDSLGRTLETYDNRLGGTPRITLTQYNARDQLAWTEDENGNPTDYTYDPLDNVLLSETDPSPGGSQGRPVTGYRYDEQTIGNASQPGNPLIGLIGTYWLGTNFVGQPAVHENDPAATDTSATTFSLPTGAGWPTVVSGQAFSARWSGDINIPSSGDYTFTSPSQDNSSSTSFTIDGLAVISSTGAPSSEPTYLESGVHQLSLDYTYPDSQGEAAPTLELDWACSDCQNQISQQAVPLSALTPGWANQTSTVSPAGRISFQHYPDPASAQPDYSLVKLSDGTNLITSYVYDSLGRTLKQYMPKANASATLDSTTGDLTSTPDTNYATDYTYYGDGATAAPPTDCGGGSAVDQYGQLESTTIPNGGLHSIVTVYNSAGLPIAVTNGKGTSCSVYDGEGRLTSATPHGDETNPTTYTYDPNGTQLTASNSSGTVTDVSNEAGQLTDTTDASGAEASYTYDPDGNQLQRTAATGSLGSSTHYVTSYGYNATDELTDETDPASNNYSFFYDDRGNLRGTQYPNGTFSWTDTNPDGWISDQYNRHGTITASTTTPPPDSSPLADYSYTYNADGKRLSETRTSGSNSQTTDYGYDNAGRLDQATLPDGTCRDYSYDRDSNRSQITESPTGCNGTFSTTASYSYDPVTTAGTDQLTSITTGGNTTDYAYTIDGQVLSQGTTSLTWDGFGRLATATVGANTVTYTYDPAGALMTRASSSPSKTSNYLLGDLFETDNSGSITTSYADGPAGDLASYTGPPRSTSTVSYLYYDAHGNLAAEANSSGSQTADHTYDPFGGPTDSVPSNTTIHRFTGRWKKQYDTATGDILMGARPYDPNTGRFLEVDPVPGGSLNNYDYSGQDPINNYDLDGDVYRYFGATGFTDDQILAGLKSYERSMQGWGWLGSVGRFAKNHWQDCSSGGAVGLLSGPQDVAVGCVIGVAIAAAEESKNRYVHGAGVAASVIEAIRNLKALGKAYRDAAQLLERDRTLLIHIRIFVEHG